MLDTTNWEIVTCEPFLDASRTPTIPRMLWLPVQFDGMRRLYGQHCLFRRAEKSTIGKTEHQIADDTHLGVAGMEQEVAENVGVEEGDLRKKVEKLEEEKEGGKQEVKEETVPIEKVDHIGQEI